MFPENRRLTSAAMCYYDCSIFMFDKCFSSRCVRHVLVSQSLERGSKSVNREKIHAIENPSRRRESSLSLKTDQSPSRELNRRLLVQVGFVPMLSPSLGRLRLSKKMFADSLSRKTSVEYKTSAAEAKNFKLFQATAGERTAIQFTVVLLQIVPHSWQSSKWK